MDDETQELEAELTRLRPTALPATLERRVAAELTQVEQAGVRRAKRPWWRVALPAAAALAIVAAWPGREAGTPAMHDVNATRARAARPLAADLLKPVAAENVLVAAQDEGVVTLQDGTTARRSRLQYVDTITWKNPRTNASLTWTVPREEVRVVPIAFQ